MIDKIKKIIYALPLLLMGCASWFPVVREPSAIEKISGSTSVEKLIALDNLTILSGIGGICLLGGMVLLTISRGTLGYRPIIGGLLLIVLNYVISIYASWIFLPIIGATGAISLAWGWKCVVDIMNFQKEKRNGMV